MAQLVRVDVGGGTIWVEASESAATPGGSSSITEAATPRDAARKAVETAEQLQGSLKAFCTSVIDSLKEMGDEAKPSKATVEFGINVSLEGNVYVVKGSGEASVKVMAEWDLRRDADAGK
jgi:hypothetical protein